MFFIFDRINLNNFYFNNWMEKTKALLELTHFLLKSHSNTDIKWHYLAVYEVLLMEWIHRQLWLHLYMHKKT